MAVFGLGWLVGLRAQTAGNKPDGAAITTNWIGCVVARQEDRMDPIARGPAPRTVPQAQLGLRSAKAYLAGTAKEVWVPDLKTQERRDWLHAHRRKDAGSYSHN